MTTTIPASASIALHETVGRLLRQGLLAQAVSEAGARLKADPSDWRQPVALFQLLALDGQWERAAAQLALSASLQADNAAFADRYAAVLRAEHARAQAMAGRVLPLLPGTVQQWQYDLLQALVDDERGEHALAERRRTLALEHAPAASGRIDGERFQWLGDADPRFGPCLEVVLAQGYAWVPFQRLRALRLQRPTHLCDVLWAPVLLLWDDGREEEGFVPCRYPGTEDSGDGALILARRTQWHGDGAAATGLGQRMLATDQGERPLLDVREIAFDPPPQEPAPWQS